MPFKDPERRRAYQADRRRAQRAAREGEPVQLDLPTPYRVRTALEILALLEEQINAVRFDAALGTVERARCIGTLAGVALRAVETGQLEERLAAVESVLQRRPKR